MSSKDGPCVHFSITSNSRKFVIVPYFPIVNPTTNVYNDDPEIQFPITGITIFSQFQTKPNKKLVHSLWDKILSYLLHFTQCYTMRLHFIPSRIYRMYCTVISYSHTFLDLKLKIQMQWCGHKCVENRFLAGYGMVV